jgi:phosphoribosyl-AMP cyclohydrolase
MGTTHEAGPGEAPVRFCKLASVSFAARATVQQVEEGLDLAPRFDGRGLLAAVATDADTGEVLMVGSMDAEAFRLTIATGEAHCWSRSRQALWKTGGTSGLVQKVVEIRIDDDHDAVWLRVAVAGGASCHVGYRSCLYRSVQAATDGSVRLAIVEERKVFEPMEVYGDVPNPTQL